MERSIKLGAIKKENGEYENICNASKEKKYKCPECDGDVILRKGEKKSTFST
jgi:competence CoiA-like predicted nuclease